MTQDRGSRRTKNGVVLSNRMDKTVVVRVNRVLRHPRYHKVVTKFKKYYAHDADGKLLPGDKVIITETRPLSKLKRWRVVGTWE